MNIHTNTADGQERACHPKGTRTLHRARTREEWPRSAPDGVKVRRVCLIDTETTGLDHEKHQIIEICAAVVLVDDGGNIIAMPSLGTGLQDPGHPLTPEIAALTGLADADLSGKAIQKDNLAAVIESCSAVVAFNSQFDRPFVERLLPGMSPMSWGCAMRDVDWRDLGFEPGPQGYLSMQAGRFAQSAHRAADDVLVLAELLDHTCGDGQTVMAKVLEAVDGPAWRFEARRAPYGYKDDLRERRYRWAPKPAHGIWHKHVRPADYDAELSWYRQTIGQEPAIVPLPAVERYRADRSWKPA